MKWGREHVDAHDTYWPRFPGRYFAGDGAMGDTSTLANAEVVEAIAEAAGASPRAG